MANWVEQLYHYTDGKTNPTSFGPMPAGDATQHSENWGAFLQGKADRDRAAQSAAQPLHLGGMGPLGLECLIAGPIVLHNHWSIFVSFLEKLGIQGAFGIFVATIVASSCVIAAYDVVCTRHRDLAWLAFMVWGYFIVQWAYPFSQWSGPFHFSWQIGVGAFALCWMVIFRRVPR